jgi:hypothetical protein
MKNKKQILAAIAAMSVLSSVAGLNTFAANEKTEETAVTVAAEETTEAVEEATEAVEDATEAAPVVEEDGEKPEPPAPPVAPEEDGEKPEPPAPPVAPEAPKGPAHEHLGPKEREALKAAQAEAESATEASAETETAE